MLADRRLTLAVVATVAYLAFFVALLPVADAGSIRQLIYAAAPSVAILVAGYAAIRSSGAARWAWAGLAFTALTWGSADAYDVFVSAQGDELPVPSPVDFLYYAGYLSFLPAIPILGLRGVHRHDWRSAFDAAAIVVVAGTLAWHVFLAPTFEANDGDFGTALVAAGYPLLDLALLCMVIATVYRRGGGASPLLIVLSGSALAALAADGAFTWFVLRGVDEPEALDAGWMLSYCLIAVAAVAPASARRPLAMPFRRRNWVAACAPYLAVVPLSALTFRQALAASAPLDLLLGSMAAYTLIIVRQWLTIMENTRLQDALAAESERTRAAMTELARKADELERLRAEAQFLAEHDGLTGLLNHRAWFAKAPVLRPRAVAVFDIDHFKQINDSHGHPAGDIVLRELAVRLREQLPSALIIGRLGGEEFGVVFGGSPERAIAECEAAVHAIGRTPMRLPSGLEVLVTISGGIAPCDSTGDIVHDLLAAYERADTLMYRAKQAGRNRLEARDPLAA